MAVTTLQIAGILDQMSTFLNDKIHNVYLINMIIGFLSSVIDNVPLVAAAIGMYPLIHTSGTLSPYLMNFTTDGTFLGTPCILFGNRWQHPNHWFCSRSRRYGHGTH